MPDTYRTVLEQIARTKSSIVTVFADFCKISACALSAGAREDEYLETIKPYSKDELSLLCEAFALLIQEAENTSFTDILGEYYLEIAAHSSKQARGEFYTPPPVCEMMVKMAVNADEVIAAGKPITVNEPACGSGNMVLALAKQFSPLVQNGEKSHVDLLRVTCQDINPVGIDMCFINTSIWGIPAHMICGDTLRMNVNNSWKNIHWHRVGEDERQQFLQVMDLLKAPANPEQVARPANTHPSSSSPATAQLEQAAFDFELNPIDNKPAFVRE